MYKLLALALGILMSAGLVAAMGWWALVVSFGLSLLTVVLSSEPEDPEEVQVHMAGTQPAGL